jgi:hypothetical protein
MDEYPVARVEEIDGQLVMTDPFAVGMIQAIGKINCKETLKIQRDRVLHFTKRIKELGKSPDDFVITILNVNDVFGGCLAEMLMPGYNWQEIRDRGEIPFARGLAGREGIQNILDDIDKDAAQKLRDAGSVVTVVVMDHSAVEVFKEGDW